MTSLPPLSPRERLILTHLDRSAPLIEIGSTLFVTRNTVKTQVRAIYSKLGVHSRAEAVARARELGLLPASESGTMPADDAPTDSPFPEQRTAAPGEPARDERHTPAPAEPR